MTTVAEYRITVSDRLLWPKSRTTTSGDLTLVVGTHQLVAVTGNSAAVTITLPTAVGNTGDWFIVKDEGHAAATYNITIATTSSQTIEDGASTTALINMNGQAIAVYSDGANWKMF
jgi:hypothetical protein